MLTHLFRILPLYTLTKSPFWSHSVKCSWILRIDFLQCVCMLIKRWNIWIQTNTARWLKHFPAILSNSVTQLELKPWWHWTKTAIESPFQIHLSSSATWKTEAHISASFMAFCVFTPSCNRFPGKLAFLYFDRLLCHIIGGFLGALALKVCPLLSVLMRKWVALHWYVPEQQWKFNGQSVNNTQQNQMCASIKISVLCLCLFSSFVLCRIKCFGVSSILRFVMCFL